MKKMTDRKLREVTAARFDIDLNMPKDYPPIKARPTEEGGVRDRFFAAVAELPDEITVVRPFNTDAFERSNENTFYVAEDGDDGDEGTRESPLGTIRCALEKARGLGGARIILRGGSYELTETLNITKEHSGTEESPLIIKSENGEKAVISASVRIPASAFRQISDGPMKDRLKAEARDRVLEADLKSLGITDLGQATVNVGGYRFVPGAFLLINGAQQDLARYPNADRGYLRIGDRIINDGFTEDGDGPFPWEIGMSDETFLGWEWRDDLCIYGSLTAEYDKRWVPLGSFDREKKSVKGKYPYERCRIFDEINNGFFFANVFEELDAPGEWYIDRDAGILYLIPPEGELRDSDDVRLVTRPLDLIRAEGAAYVILDGLDIGRCAGTAVYALGCSRFLIERCRIAGTCECDTGDKSALMIEEGYRCGVIASTIEYFSNPAVTVSGGDRKKLIPSNSFVQNCTVINPKCRFGILGRGGVGNIVSHNYIENTTMGDSGQNEGIYEYNIIKGGDTVAHDTGMIYVGGGGCSSCGNHYRYNYFYDFAKVDYGVYFDDLSRGMYAYGNIVVGNGTTGDGTTWDSGGRSYNHHNGGEHCFWNNISIDAGYFAFGGDISYWLTNFDHWKSFFAGIYGAAVEMSNEKYLGRNPTYRDYVKAVFQHHKDLEDPDYVEKSGWAERRLRTPWCNHYENNVIVRAARPFKLDNGEETATGLDTNFITDEDPGFVDFEGRDYRIRPDAPLYKKIPDFIPPPFEKMGLTDDFAEEE